MALSYDPNCCRSINDWRKEHGEAQYFCATVGETNKRCDSQYDLNDSSGLTKLDPCWSRLDTASYYRPMFNLKGLAAWMEWKRKGGQP